MEFILSSNKFLGIYLLVLAGILGLIIGSFLNVVALRLMSEESILFPGSHCTKCDKKINWYDNLPVLSYLFLGGKCRFCKEPISIQYPIVELVTSLFFLAIVFVFGITLKSLFLMILVSFMTVITITDLKEQLIYDVTSFPLIPLGLIYNFFDIGKMNSGVLTFHLAGIGQTIHLPEIFVSAVIGAIVGALFFELFSRLGLLLVGEYAFGGGDSVIAAGFGAWFGWKYLVAIIVLSFIFQVLIGIPIILHNMFKDKDYKSLISMAMLFLSLAIPFVSNSLGLSNSVWGAIITLILAFGLALVGVVIILQRAKQRQSYTFIPFGPALVFGTVIMMFFGQYILANFIKIG